MMDEPTAPGLGLPVYQPATVVVDGTCIEPPAARPSVIRLVFTPISGMVSETGLAIWAAADCGGGTLRPGGAGRAPPPAPARPRGRVRWPGSRTPAGSAPTTDQPGADSNAA